MGIEVLLYVSVGLFSLVFSIMWEKFNLFNVAKKNHKLQYWTVFIVLYLSTCVVVYYFNMKAQKRNAELIEQKVELSQFELKTQKKADIIIKKESVENKVVNTLQQYLKADHEKNIKRIDTFFTFPMEKYYMFMNPSKEKNHSNALALPGSAQSIPEQFTAR